MIMTLILCAGITVFQQVYLSPFILLSFFSYYLHKEIALLLIDYDLQQYILGQLPEQNVLHLQFSIFC